MSKKKKRTRKESATLAASELLQTDDRQSISNEVSETTKSRKTNWLAYLRAHWSIALVMAFLSLGALGAGLKYLEQDAQKEITRRSLEKGQINNQEQGFLSRINPFLPASMPNPTPQLSKEYIYAASKSIAVEDAGAYAAPPADLAIWRPSTGIWWVMGGNGSQQVSQAWGMSGDEPQPGDYDGDGKTDFCVFRINTTSHTGTWYLMYSSTGSTVQISFGLDTDKAASADYDGDGRTDIAVFRSSNQTWYINQSSTTNTVSQSFGNSGDAPTPADFDGDGKADIAVWRNSNATFYSLNSTNGQAQTTSYGSSADKPVCADYDGDGRDDIAVWRASNRTWYVRQSTNNQTFSYQWGLGTDLPVHNDYDADGRVDMALWRAVESSQGAGDVGRWYILQSSTNTIRQEQWGIANDIPVPSFYRR